MCNFWKVYSDIKIVTEIQFCCKVVQKVLKINCDAGTQ